MNELTPIYVLDTSAWLTLIEDEAGADTVQDILEKAKVGEAIVLVSFVSFMEVYYITLQERDVNEARERVNLMAAMPVLRVESTRALGIAAAELKAEHRLSVADAWIAALAEERGATLVHKDPEFEQVEAVVKVLELPYKSTVRSGPNLTER
jgi:predicted nucleic acid-binding protein